MSFTRVIIQRLRGHAWPVVVPMYKLRQCPECGALVLGWDGQNIHEAWHEGGDEEEYEEEEVDGYVIGAGELPEELRGGSE